MLITLHYLGGSAASWAAVADALPPTLRAHTLDLPGFGDATGQDGYTVAAMADHVEAAIAALAPHRFFLAGHSMGAKVAAVLARRAEDAGAASPLRGLAGLVLVAGSPPSPEPIGDERRREMLSWFAGTPSEHRAQADRFVAAGIAAPLAGALHAGAVADVLRARPEAWRAWLTRGINEDWADRIGVLQTPALLVAGSDDADLGPKAQTRLMAPHFRHVRLETIAGAAHLLPLERPAELAAMIARFAV